MTYNFEEDMKTAELKPYTAQDLRSGILDMIEWASEDGMSWWQIYGVISAIEKHLELVYKSDLLMTAKDLEDCEDD
jgi:hypothetical protein